MIDPDCTPGWAIREPDGTVTGHCGCGWSEEGFPSKRQALIAQKAHRFPPLPEDLPAPRTEAPDDGEVWTADAIAQLRAKPQWLPRTPPSIPTRRTGT